MLHSLIINNLRNIHALQCEFHPKLTIFHGANGSGKSSILEAIHLLALGRSFRARHNKHMVQYQQPELSVSGKLLDVSRLTHTVGMIRSLDNKNTVHFDGDPVQNSSLLAQNLPLQMLEPQSFELLSGSPDARRQYIDWGVFHVEHDFYAVWRKVQRIIKQRNALLKKACRYADLAIWDKELAAQGEVLHQMRDAYVSRLVPVLNQMLQTMAPEFAHALHLKYSRGWSQQLSLREALEKHFPHDSITGYTHIGPQRATMQVLHDGQPAYQVLSKGQQKCVVCALRLGQSIIFDQEKPDTPCLFLIDDLSAELDSQNQQRFATILLELKNQVFATCINPSHLQAFTQQQPDHKMFHVEHGIIHESTTVLA